MGQFRFATFLTFLVFVIGRAVQKFRFERRSARIQIREMTQEI